MNGKQHLKLYLLALIPFFIYLIMKVSEWYYYIPLSLLSFLIVDPDDDLKIGIKAHRSAWTHSIIFILVIYYSLTLIPEANIPFELVQTLCYPLLVHMVGDLKLEYKGSAAISIWPFRGRLTSNATIFWMFLNISTTCLLIFSGSLFWCLGIFIYLIICSTIMNVFIMKEEHLRRKRNERKTNN